MTAGAITGLVVGMTGVGGGALMTPILLMIFGTAPLTAIGTDLWFASLTKVAIAGIHQRHGLIDWAVVRRLWSGSLPASALVLYWLRSGGSRAPSFLVDAIAVAVCITAIGVLLQKRLHAFALSVEARSRSLREWQVPATIAAGATLGVLVTLTSVGAGAVGVVCLLYLYPTRLTPARLVATDVAHAIPLAMFAGVGHLTAGSVDVALLRDLLIGSVPAAVAGATLSARVPHTTLRAALAAVLLVVGIKMLVGN